MTKKLVLIIFICMMIMGSVSCNENGECVILKQGKIKDIVNVGGGTYKILWEDGDISVGNGQWRITIDKGSKYIYKYKSGVHYLERVTNTVSM